MRRRRPLLVAALTASLLLGLPVQAKASTLGGDIHNSCSSGGYVDVWNTNPDGYLRLQPCDDSRNYPYWHDKVQAFRIPSGCIARSQYSPAGSWPYKGGIKYVMSHDNINLTLQVSCTI